MDFAVYPFKRDNKYRLYVRFEDEQGKRKHLSAGVTYPLDASKKERKRAQKRAEKKVKQTPFPESEEDIVGIWTDPKNKIDIKEKLPQIVKPIIVKVTSAQPSSTG